MSIRTGSGGMERQVSRRLLGRQGRESARALPTLEV